MMMEYAHALFPCGAPLAARTDCAIVLTAGSARKRTSYGVIRAIRRPTMDIAHVFTEGGAQRVGNDVARDGAQVFVAANAMVEKAGLPDVCNLGVQIADCMGTARLEAIHRDGKRGAFAQCEEPVQVIRHQDPGVRMQPAGFVQRAHYAYDRACRVVGSEQRPPPGGRRDDVVGLAGQRNPADAQTVLLCHARIVRQERPMRHEPF